MLGYAKAQGQSVNSSKPPWRNSSWSDVYAARAVKVLTWFTFSDQHWVVDVHQVAAVVQDEQLAHVPMVMLSHLVGESEEQGHSSLGASVFAELMAYCARIHTFSLFGQPVPVAELPFLSGHRYVKEEAVR
jgi:hypothetical protein